MNGAERKKSLLWFKQNSLAGDIVFQSDWDEFPMMFYHNSKNYYIVWDLTPLIAMGRLIKFSRGALHSNKFIKTEK